MLVNALAIIAVAAFAAVVVAFTFVVFTVAFDFFLDVVGL